MEPDPDHAGVGKRPEPDSPLGLSVSTAPVAGRGFFMTTTPRSNATIGGLYLITDASDSARLFECCQLALRGGVRQLQYRDKTRPFDEQLAIAQRLRQLCHHHQAQLIINDNIALARACMADGVHLGQQDGAIAVARAALGPAALIGRSCRTVAQALAAAAEGANYLGVGSVYPTRTKNDAVHIGLEGLRAIRAAVDLPLVAIGGIDAAGLPAVIAAGADGAAVVSALMTDPRPDLAAREMALLFHRRQPVPCGRVLTIAGSDSGGGAGIQADIKTISLLGGYASSVITALTAQNTLGVSGIHAVPANFVRQQLRAVLDDLGADVIKTGMLLNSEIIRTVAEELRGQAGLTVVDPVMIAKGGASLLQQDAIDALISQLLPQTYLLTPNLPEAEALTGRGITSVDAMEQAAIRLQQLGARHVLIKGGHLAGAPVDLLRQGTTTLLLQGERLDSAHTHGTGCTTAAAVAALLARGFALAEAVRLTKTFIETAIRLAPGYGQGHGPVNHYLAAAALRPQLD